MNIKSLFVTIFIVLLSLVSVEARDVAVRGYTKDNGTYVQPHHRSSPNEYKNDNWSTSGNSNPYTGQSGTNSHKGTCSALTINC
jgi:hypothetical protein